MVEERIEKFVKKLKQNQFLFEELVKRDFKKRYARTVLGMAWSILNLLLQLLVMKLVFTNFFGRNTPHYTTYLFSGLIVFNYFSKSIRKEMTSIGDNASVFTKINVIRDSFKMFFELLSIRNNHKAELYD